MPISVYSQEAVIVHSVTRRLAKQITETGLAKRFGQQDIQLTTDMAWPEIKRLARAHVPSFAIRLMPDLPTIEYPPQMTCMELAFQRTMRYPVQMAREQRSWPYSFHAPQPQSQPVCA